MCTLSVGVRFQTFLKLFLSFSALITENKQHNHTEKPTMEVELNQPVVKPMAIEKHCLKYFIVIGMPY